MRFSSRSLTLDSRCLFFDNFAIAKKCYQKNPSMSIINYRHNTLSVFLLLIMAVGFSSCSKRNPLIVDISEVAIAPEFYHFEEALFEIPDTLFFDRFPGIYPDFSPLFMQRELDSLLIAEMLIFSTEPRFIELFEQKSEVIGDMQKEKSEIINILKHFRHYYPEASDHTIFTHISGLDMHLIHSPVILNDTLAVISTDLYLGKDYEPYQYVGIPEYKRRWMTPEQIAPEFARQLAFLKAGSPEYAETLLDQMIYQGKTLYFLDAMMPRAHDTTKIRFTKQQLDWCVSNQRHVWAYIINNQMLYSSEQSHNKLMIQDAPFTPVFSELSPGRIGHWIGWQIVRRYMEKNPGTTLEMLMNEYDSQKILTESAYKPR